MEEFESTLVYLTTKVEISPNSPIYISLPNILTSIKTFPSDIEDIELEVALSSEAEKSYIFKKTEPKASWNLVSSNKETLTNAYLYSVLQKEQVDVITQIFINNKEATKNRYGINDQ